MSTQIDSCEAKTISDPAFVHYTARCFLRYYTFHNLTAFFSVLVIWLQLTANNSLRDIVCCQIYCLICSFDAISVELLSFVSSPSSFTFLFSRLYECYRQIIKWFSEIWNYVVLQLVKETTCARPTEEIALKCIPAWRNLFDSAVCVC